MTSFISGYISTLILNTLTLNIVLKILLKQRKGFYKFTFLIFYMKISRSFDTRIQIHIQIQ